MISHVNEQVGRINSTFGTLDGFPIHYINKSVNFDDLCALYALADALIVTSIRDGMNLVSSEFVVVQDERCRQEGVTVDDLMESPKCLSPTNFQNNKVRLLMFSILSLYSKNFRMKKDRQVF